MPRASFAIGDRVTVAPGLKGQAAAVQRVELAARRRREADVEYRSAVVAARELGLSLRRIGDAAGVTKWAIVHTLEQAAKDGAA